MKNPPFRFRPAGAPDAPILGAPFEVKAVIPTAVLVCKCEANTLIILQGLGGQAQCPACRRAFQLNGATVNAQEMAAKIAHQIPPQVEH